MKILHIITTIDVGGAEKQLLSISREQVARGHFVVVAYLKDHPRLFNDFVACGVEVYSRAASKNIFWQVSSLWNLINKRNFDVIHLHLPRAEAVGSLAAFPRSFLVSRHNLESFLPDGSKKLSKFLSRIVTLRAKKVVAITEAVKDFLIESREIGDVRKIEVVHYGIEKADFNNANTKEIRTISELSEITFGTMSRLVPQKNLDCLIEAFTKLSQVDPRHELLIAGEGILKEELRILAVATGFANSIHFRGKVDAEEFLHSIDCFILSSRYEGFGLVILEALRAGLPLICSRTEAAIEILGSNYEGLFEVGDAEQLSLLMLECRKREFRMILLENNNRILERYKLSDSVNGLEEIYAYFINRN